jgi:hypothetical protein
MRSTLLIYTTRPAAKNDSGQFMLSQFFGGDETTVEFAVDVEFADAAGD